MSLLSGKLKQLGFSDEDIAELERKLKGLSQQAIDTNLEFKERKEEMNNDFDDYGIHDLILGNGDVELGRMIRQQEAQRFEKNVARRTGRAIQPATKQKTKESGRLAALRASVAALRG